MNNRMQLDLRADIDQKLQEGWHIESRDPLTLSNSKSLRIKERTLWLIIWAILIGDVLAAAWIVGVLI